MNFIRTIGKKLIWKSSPNWSAVNERDEEIVAEHLRAAINNLERILGQIDVEDVLGNIFSNFCVGK